MAKFTVVTADKEAAILGDPQLAPASKARAKNSARGASFTATTGRPVRPTRIQRPRLPLRPSSSTRLRPAQPTGAKTKERGPAVLGTNTGMGRGSFFHSETVEGLAAETKSQRTRRSPRSNWNPTSTGAALMPSMFASLTAGFFEGQILISQPHLVSRRRLCRGFHDQERRVR